MSDLVERVAFECFAAWVNHPDKEMSRAAWERNDPISRNAWLRVATAAIAAHASARADVVTQEQRNKIVQLHENARDKHLQYFQKSTGPRHAAWCQAETLLSWYLDELSGPTPSAEATQTGKVGES